MFSFASPNHARVLFTVGVLMCAICVFAICIAEAFMPRNVHGRNGVLTFYRWFGAGFAYWAVVAAWAFAQGQSLSKRIAASTVQQR